MPELPEVETIKNELTPALVGKRISKVTIFDSKIIREPEVSTFLLGVSGQKIETIERRGKYLIFHLSGGEKLIMHLKLNGVLLVAKVSPDRFLRASFELNDGTRLFFTDRRRFARMWLTGDAAKVTGKLGPEPLAPGFTHEVFSKRLRGRKAPLKAILLDQAFVAGIGNMYADEALFAAGIHPLQSADSLSGKETRKLYKAIKEVLRSGISYKGASVDSYIRPGGSPGTAHDHFQVAHGRGKKCPVCGSAIQRIVVRGRGTYFCPKCQPLSI